MQFITVEEAREWAERYGKELDTRGFPLVPSPAHGASLRYSFEDKAGYQYLYLAREVVRSLGPFTTCLLWVTEYGVWTSNENLHLYYRVRESYGDRSFLWQRPALLALGYETNEIVTQVHLGMLFGWDMYVVTSDDYGRAFISHDGWIEFSEQTADVIAQLEASEGEK